MATPNLTSAIEGYARSLCPADVNVSLWLPTYSADVLELLLVWPARPRRKARARKLVLTFEGLMRGDWEIECAAQR